VNTVQLPRNGRRTLAVGDIVSFGGPAHVRGGAARRGAPRIAAPRSAGRNPGASAGVPRARVRAARATR
jgi:hypothetical protein